MSILHVSMASNDGASYLPAVTDLSINGRQAMGDTSGQSDHECMAFREQYVPGSSWRSRAKSRAIVTRLHGEVWERKVEKDRSRWLTARYL